MVSIRIFRFFLLTFFFTHSCLPSGTLVPQKILRVGKRFLYWPVTRYAQSTKSPKINLTAREVDWAWWSQGAARWEVGQRGAGPLHHWWRHLLGWRAATMRRLACQHGSKWPTTRKWVLWQLLVAGAGGLTVFWFVPTVGGTVLPPRSISHRLPLPEPPDGTVPTPPIRGRCVLLFVVQRARLSLRTCPLSAVVRLHLWGGRLGLCPPPIGNPAIGGGRSRWLRWPGRPCGWRLGCWAGSCGCALWHGFQLPDKPLRPHVPVASPCLWGRQPESMLHGGRLKGQECDGTGRYARSGVVEA